MAKNHDPLENILGRVEDLDATSLSNLVSRLARERRLLNLVFNTLREGVLVIDSYGTVDYANNSAIDLLGINPREIGSIRLWKAVPDLARTLNMTRSGQIREVVNLSREVVISYPEERVVRLYMVPFEEDPDDAAIVRYAIIISDVTQEKSQTRQELENERVKSIIDLAAGVAHELGNPLNSLTIHLQVVRRNLQKLNAHPGIEKIEQSLGICTGEVERLDSIIRNFLEAVRPQKPDFQDLNLMLPLEESIEFLGPELESAGISVDVSTEANLPIILGDHNQIKQVFFNIIKNARQAMKAGGTIKVRASSDDTFVNIQIGDTGVGIAESELPKVFQPYYTTKKGGSGLGMMIVERILRDHGGKVGLDSRESVGTVVSLQFPQKNRRVRLLEES